MRVYLEWHLMNRWYSYLYQHVKLFVGERFKYGFRKSFMSSIVAPPKILALTEFGFAPDSLLSSISWSMESPAIYVVPFAHGVGIVGGVLLW